MKPYVIRLFQAIQEGRKTGEFIDRARLTLDDWLAAQVDDGYRVMSVQPIVHEERIHVVVTTVLAGPPKRTETEEADTGEVVIAFGDGTVITDAQPT